MISKPLVQQPLLSKNAERIRQFSLNLEKGDLGLQDLIDYGFVLYGQTKTGKTASGHILSGNPLKGQKKDGQQMVETTTSRNKKAKIGNQGNSQTIIPNFFQVKFNTSLQKDTIDQTKTYVVDTPGYGDSYGVLSILANGYYHYRMYSKVKNMKFILCFQRSHISNTAKQLIDTIRQFTSYFKEYLENKQQIWKSCAFLITKVDQSDDILRDLKQKLTNIVDTLVLSIDEDQGEALKEFIRFIVKQQRIFYIKKIKAGQQAQYTGFLQQIDKKIKNWWRRDLVPEKNIVDMTKIQFSLAKQLILQTTRQSKSKNQFGQLIKYYNQRINQFVELVTQKNAGERKSKGSLAYVIDQLVKDSMGQPDSHQFLNYMETFKAKYYNLYDNLYRYQRQKKQKKLFALPQHDGKAHSNNSLSNKKDKYNEKSYIVKKFDALIRIEELKKQINRLPKSQRSIGWLDKCQQNIFNIIKEFNKISYKRNKCSQLIYKYGYIIHRIIEEAKVFTLLLEVGCSQEHKLRLQQGGKYIIDFISPLRDFMGLGYMFQENQFSSQQLKELYVKRFNLNNQSIKNLVINQSLINFFAPNTKSPDQQVIKKNINLVYLYSQQILRQFEQSQQSQQSLQDQMLRLIKRLCISRINLQNCYHLTFEIQKQTADNIMLIRKLTNNLGRVLQALKKYQTARKVYDTIKYVDSSCRIYKQQLKIKPKDIDLRLQFARYLSNHFRQNQATYILQQTFQVVENKAQLDTVTKQLTQLKLKIKDKTHVNTYEHSLYNSQYFIEFSTELQEQIQGK